MGSDRKPSDLEHMDDVVPLNEEPNMLQYYSNNLNGSVGMCWVFFAPSKCIMLLKDRTGLKRNFIIEVEQLAEVTGFSFVDNTISFGGFIPNDVCPRIQKL